MDSYRWTYRSWPTSKNLLSAALCGHWVLSRGLVKGYIVSRDSARLDKDDDSYKSIAANYITIGKFAFSMLGMN